MKVLMCVALVCLVTWRGSDASGAGRSLPMAAENYVIELFSGVNPLIEWDPSNFLIDLAGRFANCKWVGKRGFVKVDRNTPEGGSIVAIVDYTSGSNADAPSVSEYVKRVFKKWMQNSAYVAQIRKSDMFGCGVRPACSGRVSVSCLFTPGGGVKAISTVNPIAEPPTTTSYIREPSWEQRALAFTREQYDLAEAMTHTPWDRSHFLENLSGYETDCAMIGQREWYFTQARDIAGKVGIDFSGLFGYARNRGSTTNALKEIFESFKELPTAKEVGCSVIPDCKQKRGDISAMYVVVGCIYAEK
ncbi:hypothetical protein NP493_1855g00039 [Ridgeia piscesae]|uniref:SCP domain-containing protein n=1 Tax=Ridgeia piscesae TaxID=27915 RepID=A0AAD9N765_RIDPI|nr:hypothetical protein NP493_1855g00039 [Ridgeia piscesae]